MDWTVTIGSLTLGILDLIILAICLISSIACAIRGFVSEFCHFAGILIGFAVGFLFAGKLASLLSEVIKTNISFLLPLASFVILCLVGYLLVRVFQNLLLRIVETMRLGIVDNILGFVWGLVASFFVLSSIMYLLSMQNIFDFGSFFNSSIIATKLIKPFFPQALVFLKEFKSV